MLGISERQLRQWEKLGLVEAAEVYHFHGLIALRTLTRLREAKLPVAQIHRAVVAVRRKLSGSADPLTEVRLYSEGNRIRVQLGGYGGGGFIEAGQGVRPRGGPTGRVFDEELYIETIPKLFEHLRNKVGFGPKLLHDAQEHFSPMKAIQLAKLLEPSRLFFLEDVLNLEQLPWYRTMRQQTVTPQAAHEKLTSPSEYIPLISERLVDFIRFRLAKVGGLTAARKIASMAELYGVRTAFQEGADNDPVSLAAAMHLDTAIVNFGIQEENHFTPQEVEAFPGTPIVERGFLYPSDRPGLGVDIKEELMSKLLTSTPGGRMVRYYPSDRKADGSFVRP
jgi:mannonate dehydratase